MGLPSMPRDTNRPRVNEYRQDFRGLARRGKAASGWSRFVLVERLFAGERVHSVSSRPILAFSQDPNE